MLPCPCKCCIESRRELCEDSFAILIGNKVGVDSKETGCPGNSRYSLAQRLSWFGLIPCDIATSALETFGFKDSLTRFCLNASVNLRRERLAGGKGSGSVLTKLSPHLSYVGTYFEDLVR